MANEIIKKQWESYRKQCVPANAGPEQVQETRRAFYGGAKAMMAAVLAASDLTEKEATDILESMETELNQFLSDLKAGKV